MRVGGFSAGRLLEGEFQAGERLSVEALKAEFGVSKQPVMEALRRLSSEGLVEIIPQVGCRVPVCGSADVIDFFAIFGDMEGAVAGVALSGAPAPKSTGSPPSTRRSDD